MKLLQSNTKFSLQILTPIVQFCLVYVIGQVETGCNALSALRWDALCPFKGSGHDMKEPVSAIFQSKCVGSYSRNLRPSEPNTTMHATKKMLNADIVNADMVSAVTEAILVIYIYICWVTLR